MAYPKSQYLQDLQKAQDAYRSNRDDAAYDAALNEIANKVQNELASNPKGTDLVTTDLGAVLSMSPKLLAAKQAEALQAQKTGQVNQGLDILFQGVQMAIGGNQVAKAKNAAAQLQRPSLPGIASSNPQLAQALNDAKLGTINVNDVLRPAQAGIQDAYNSALNQAQVASGGQAGAYQGMANLANLQRMRANLGLAPVAQEAKLQNQQVYNQLLRQKLGETQDQFQNRYANSQIAFDQYDKDAQAVGDLGSVGRTNMLNAGRQLTQSLQGLTPYFTQPRLKSTLPTPQFDPSINNYIGSIQKENGLRNKGMTTYNLDEIQYPFNYD